MCAESRCLRSNITVHRRKEESPRPNSFLGGAPSWRPIAERTAGAASDDAEAHALKLRYYWGIRFYAWSATSFYSKVTAALVKEMGQGALSVYTNYKCVYHCDAHSSRRPALH